MRRYIRVMDCPDRFTADICWIDTITGEEILRYDGADPANTKEEYGAVPDEIIFARKGLNIHEEIEKGINPVDSSKWMHRYTQPDYEGT